MKASFNTATPPVPTGLHDDENNVVSELKNHTITAGQVPTVVSAKITGPNTITIEFSEAISAATRENFSNLKINGESRSINTATLSTTMVTLNVFGPNIPTDATGTINMKASFNTATPPVPTGLMDLDNIEVEELQDHPITDGQPPTLANGYPKNTGPNEITIKFTEPVTVARAHFSAITASGETTPRDLVGTPVSTSNDTITLQFGGAAIVASIDDPLTMSISNKITDSAGTQFIVVDNTADEDNFYTGIIVEPGQAPTVKSAKITAGHTIVIEFSEAVDAVNNSDFTFYESSTRSRPIIDITNSGNAIITLALDDTTTPLSATATGQILIKDTVHNTSTDVPIKEDRYDVTAGQIPTIESAKILAPDDPTDEDGSPRLEIIFSEAIKVEDIGTDEIDIGGTTFDAFFNDFKLTSGTDISSGETRELVWEDDTITNAETKTTFTFTITGGDVPPDATGTVSIIGIMDTSTPAVMLNNKESTLNHPVTDGQSPTITSIKITAPNTITIKSDEPINATLDNFNTFVLNDGISKNITNIDGSDPGTILLNIVDNSLKSDASGTMNIAPTIVDGKQTTLIDMAGNPVKFMNIDDPPILATSGFIRVLEGQVPTIESAKITSHYNV